MKKRRPEWAVPPAGLAVVAAATFLAAAAAGCGSGRSHVAVTASSTTVAPVTTTVPPSTTTRALTTTVSNCGGGAYEPRTLLIVCGVGADTVDATGVVWTSWKQTTATGTGTVHLYVAGRSESASGRLLLDGERAGPVGPQFRRLVVTWTGPSPDGRPADTYALQVGA